ncbi:MAG: hypothetical protein ACRDXB_10870, partial [Actinomycetes bacterium]
MSAEPEPHEHASDNTAPDQVVDAELLSDVEGDYVSRWLAYDKAQRAGERSGAIARRPETALVPRGAELARRAIRMRGSTRQWIVGRIIAPTASAWRAEPVLQARTRLGYRVRKLPLDLVRLVWFIARGNWRWARKVWAYLTYADLRADARAARTAGDVEARRTAQELIRSDSRARWTRVAMATETARRILAALAVVGGVLWLADATTNRADMWPWLARV